jgi:hypothetical protein
MNFIRSRIISLFTKDNESSNDFYDYLNENIKYDKRIKKKILTYPDLTNLVKSNHKELITA